MKADAPSDDAPGGIATAFDAALEDGVDDGAVDGDAGVDDE
jgi:hypothetical protein